MALQPCGAEIDMAAFWHERKYDLDSCRLLEWCLLEKLQLSRPLGVSFHKESLSQGQMRLRLEAGARLRAFETSEVACT